MTDGETGVEAVVQAEGEVASASSAAVAAAEVMKHRLHGFDAFRGLPEDWEFTEEVRIEGEEEGAGDG